MKKINYGQKVHSVYSPIEGFSHLSLESIKRQHCCKYLNRAFHDSKFRCNTHHETYTLQINKCVLGSTEQISYKALKYSWDILVNCFPRVCTIKRETKCVLVLIKFNFFSIPFKDLGERESCITFRSLYSQGGGGWHFWNANGWF
jgi:hypothetical protein